MATSRPATTTDLETALCTTGAIRQFNDRPVSRGDLARILDVARFAPSGGNQQPWHVVSVEAPALRVALGVRIVSAAREYVALGRAGQRPFGLTDHGRWPGPGDVDLAAARAEDLDLPAFEGIARAPAVLAVCVELGRLAAMDAELDRHGLVPGASIYPFCWNLMLAARAHGLGGVMTTFLSRVEPAAAPALGLPDHHALVTTIFLGHPVHQPTKLKRNPVESFATTDRFDGAAFS